MHHFLMTLLLGMAMMVSPVVGATLAGTYARQQSEEAEEQTDTSEETESEELSDDAVEDEGVVEEDAEDLAGYKTEQEVPVELRPAWRNMHRDYTQKTQSIARLRQQEEELRASGWTLDQIVQITKGVSSGQIVPQQQADPAASDSLIAKWRAKIDGGSLYPEQIEDLEGMIDTRRLALRQTQAIEQQRLAYENQNRENVIRTQLQQLQQADSPFTSFLKTPAGQTELLNHARTGGFPTLISAARDLYFDRVRQTTATAKQAASVSAATATLRNGKSGQKAAPPKPPSGSSMAQRHAWNVRNNPDYLK